MGFDRLEPLKEPRGSDLLQQFAEGATVAHDAQDDDGDDGVDDTDEQAEAAEGE